MKVVIKKEFEEKFRELGILTIVKKAVKIPWAKRYGSNDASINHVVNDANKTSIISCFVDKMCPWEHTKEGKDFWGKIIREIDEPWEKKDTKQKRERINKIKRDHGLL